MELGWKRHSACLQHRMWLGMVGVLVVAGCATAAPSTDEARFAGAWHTKWCDSANPTDEKCGHFNLYLTQEFDRICGGHFVATPGLSRVDEGDYDSVKGTFDGDVATVVVTNSRNGSTHLAKMTRTGDRLEWDMVGTLTAGINDEPAIIPLGQTLRPDDSQGASEMLSRIRSLPCRWPDESKRPLGDQ